MAENDKTIVSRIQHRRGLKQDLPQPLRPGEIGLAVDSKQVYIGHDPDNPNSVDLSTTSFIENTVSARDHVIVFQTITLLHSQFLFTLSKRVSLMVHNFQILLKQKKYVLY